MLETIYFAFWNLVAFALVMWFALYGRRQEDAQLNAEAERRRKRAEMLLRGEITPEDLARAEREDAARGLLQKPSEGGAIDWT
ncbi:MAG: hypothetical protein KatS3mg119_2400 [Rhodothalassiaceae bacterium]|nr:MAG: hypothetical protein KatS3mg119_2400 [Rhodothalassiaceae bacterium]